MPDSDRAAEQVRRMAPEFSFPVGMLKDATQNGFGPQAALPVTYVVDPEGTVRTQMRPDSGPLNEANLARTVGPLLPQR